MDILNILKGLFKVAVECGYIKTNTCDGIKRHKLDNGRIVLNADSNMLYGTEPFNLYSYASQDTPSAGAALK
jgi:hypothetical protein